MKIVQSAWDQIIGLRSAYRQTFATSDGQQVLKDLLKFGGQTSSSFIPGMPDGTSFNEGKRRVVLRILGYLEMTDQEIMRISGESDEENLEENSYGG